MTSPVLNQYIEINPGMMSGKPHIAGHRITVQNIAIWHERLGMSADEIATEYDLSLAEVYAALSYYFDHRDEIDQAMTADDAVVQALRERTPSILSQKLQVRRATDD